MENKHAYTLTCLHTYMLTHLHAYTLTCLHTYMLTHLHAYTLTCVHTKARELDTAPRLVFMV
jgi:hypothetical protein